MINLQKEAGEIAELEHNIRFLESTLEEETATHQKSEQQLHQTQAAQEILQLVAQTVQQQAHEKIGAIVSSCLKAVFDDPYEFKIIFDRKRGRTEARLLFTRRGLEVDPLSASGGGVVDVAAFALRIACLMLHRPRLSKLVILDEPFRFVSAQYQDNVRSMLEGLSHDLKLQIVYITHNDNLAAGRIIEVTDNKIT